MLTGTPPFAKLSTSEVLTKVLGGERPLKPPNAPELGLSDKVWKLVEDCWQAGRTLRPSVKDILGCVKAAAWACGPLSSVGGAPETHEGADTCFSNFGEPPLPSHARRALTPRGADGEDTGACYKHIPEPDPSSSLTSAPLTMDRPPSQGSIFTDSSTSDSLFSILSAAESATTELACWKWKGGDTDALTNALFGPASDHARELKHQSRTAVLSC